MTTGARAQSIDQRVQLRDDVGGVRSMRDGGSARTDHLRPAHADVVTGDVDAVILDRQRAAGDRAGEG